MPERNPMRKTTSSTRPKSTKRPTKSNRSLETIITKLIAMMSKKNSGVDPEELNRFREKIQTVWNYTPTVCLFGQVGAGKSSLCNALFGENRFEISPVEACTKAAQDHTVEITRKGKLRVIDMPGMGESQEKDETYQALYEETVTQADLVIWALKSDSRAFASDLQSWKLISKRLGELETPVFFLLTQADKIDPTHEWNRRGNLPGSEQLGNLLLKKKVVARDFGVNSLTVVPVSSTTGYGLKDLVFAMLVSLPDEKKTGFYKLTIPSVQSEEARKEADRGFFNTIFEWCKESAKTVFNFIINNRREILDIGLAVLTVILTKKPRKGK
jgi:uncharacterized protein